MPGPRARPAPLLALLAAVALVCAPASSAGGEPARQAVPKSLIRVDDGDSLFIDWPAGPEVVRVLGIDTPEVQHLEHDLPYAQPFGERATGFLEGALAVASRVEVQRAAEKDPYGRTLAYVFLDGRNYSVLVVTARLAIENASHFGDNGFPAEAAAVKAAAAQAGPVPFEPPYRFRQRMHAVSAWMRQHGTYPVRPAPYAPEPGKEEGR